MDIIYRRMDASNVNDMADLEAACFSQPWSAAQIAFEIDNPHAVYFCAMCDNKTVGFVGMHNIIGEGYITNVAVNSDYRRLGIADKLLELLYGYAEENSMDFISLEVRVSNAPAISLYTKNGFIEEGRRKNFYELPREDALIMTRRF